MDDWVEALLDLQATDQRIQKLQAQVDSVPREKKRVEAESAEAETAVEAAHKGLQQVQIEIKELESKVESVKTRMKDFQTKTTMIKDNNEYKKALGQIENCKQEISGYEDRELELMEKLEATKADHAKQKKAFEAMQNRIADMQSDLETRAKNAGAQLEKTRTKRAEIRASVPPKALRLYERLAKSPQRLAAGRPVLVPMRGETCGFCNMKVTAQTRVNVNKAQLVTCDHCSSMLYAES